MVKWIKSYGQIRQMGYSIVILLRRSLELKDGYLKSGYWSGFRVTFPDMLYQLIEYLRSNCYKERLAKWGFNGDLLCSARVEMSLKSTIFYCPSLEGFFSHS